jgi:hypothetical protein
MNNIIHAVTVWLLTGFDIFIAAYDMVLVWRYYA